MDSIAQQVAWPADLLRRRPRAAKRPKHGTCRGAPHAAQPAEDHCGGPPACLGAARPRGGSLLAAVAFGRGARILCLGAQAGGALGERLAARLVGAQLPARLGRRGLGLPQLGGRARALLRGVSDENAATDGRAYEQNACGLEQACAFGPPRGARLLLWVAMLCSLCQRAPARLLVLRLALRALLVGAAGIICGGGLTRAQRALPRGQVRVGARARGVRRARPLRHAPCLVLAARRGRLGC